MRKLWVCLFYALCVFTIAFSLFWMALPSTAAQAQAETLSLPYYLCDEGGRVAVYRCNADGTPEQRILLTGIYVNLLPEGDALRIKAGLRVPGEAELRQLLEDLGA